MVKLCEHCGETYKAKGGRQMWCSDKCRYAARDHLRMIPCYVCSKPMHRGRTLRKDGRAKHRACKYPKSDVDKFNLHGRTGYNSYGCRCDVCRAAVAAYNRQWFRDYKEKTGESYGRRFTDDYFRAWITKANRLKVYERDNWTCQICLWPVDPTLDGRTDRMAATLDHVECVSWSDEPDHSLDNLRLAHRACNSARNAGREVTPESARKMILAQPTRQQAIKLASM